MSLADWEKIVDKLLFVKKEMRECSKDAHLTLEGSDLLAIYFQKTVDRLELLLEDPVFQSFYECSPDINGELY